MARVAKMKSSMPSGRKLAILANSLLAILAVLTVGELIHALAFTLPLPPPPTRVARQDPVSVPDGALRGAGNDEGFERYRIIIDRPLFNPSRRESKPTEALAPAAPLPPPPLLYGVVFDGDLARAYLKERGTARVLSYRVGDAIAGGVIEAIGKDRVSISRAGVKLRVMLLHPGPLLEPRRAGSTVLSRPAAGKLRTIPPAFDWPERKSRDPR
jgi:hypothetical protein